MGQNLNSYKLFQQHVRPIIQKENPKVPMSKLMMLVAAKWRDFSASIPDESEVAEDEAIEVSSSRPTLSSRSGGAISGREEPDIPDDDDDDDDDLGSPGNGAVVAKSQADE